MDYSALKNDLLEFHSQNPKGDNPYHNNTHMAVMTDIAAGIYLKETQKVDAHDLTVLIVACMLHDWDHSGGQETDDKNILRAIAGFMRYLGWGGTGFTIDGIRGEFEEDVKNAIRCTQFPFILEPQGLVQEAIRDADILYAAMTQDPEVILTHLRAEIEIAQQRKISRKEMLAGQQAFLKAAHLYTVTGLELWENHAGRYMKLMEKACK